MKVTTSILEFKATDDQVRQIAVNAIHASSPMGMGFVHYVPGDHFRPEEIKLDNLGLNLDYVQGRMVKLMMWRTGDQLWEIRGEIDIEYQSWAGVYPTYEKLIESVLLC